MDVIGNWQSKFVYGSTFTSIQLFNHFPLRSLGYGNECRRGILQDKGDPQFCDSVVQKCPLRYTREILPRKTISSSIPDPYESNVSQ